MSALPDIDKIQSPVILFDGVCNLCSSVVQFVIKRDKKNIFRFASLQSEFGNAVLQKFHLDSSDLNSFILYENGSIYTKSTGALQVTRKLSGPIKILYYFIFIPKVIRDLAYQLISNNRYRWFGKKKACWIPHKKDLIKFF